MAKNAQPKHLKIVPSADKPLSREDVISREDSHLRSLYGVMIWDILEAVQPYTPNYDATRDFEAMLGVIKYSKHTGTQYEQQARAEARSNGAAVCDYKALDMGTCLTQLLERTKAMPTDLPAALSFVLSEYLRPPENLPIKLDAVENISGIFTRRNMIGENYTSVRDRVQNTLRIQTINRYPVRPWIESIDDIFAKDGEKAKGADKAKIAEKEAANKANYITMVVNEVAFKDSLGDQLFRAYWELKDTKSIDRPHSKPEMEKDRLNPLSNPEMEKDRLNRLYHAVTVYGPLAGELGFEKLQEQILEEVVRIADPARYNVIKEYYKAFDYGGAFSGAVEDKLRSILDDNGYEGCYDIEGGTKSVWSTYVKMRGKLPRDIAKKEKEIKKLQEAVEAKKSNTSKPYTPEAMRKDSRRAKFLADELEKLNNDHAHFKDDFSARYFDAYLHDKKRKRIVLKSSLHREKFNSASDEPILDYETRACITLHRLFSRRLTEVPDQADVYLGSAKKGNLYKAAHNVYSSEGIEGADGKTFDPRAEFELQIVGEVMHSINTNGSAAHLAYKYGRGVAKALKAASQFAAASKEVVVRTPRGDYKKLARSPRFADHDITVVDAAIEIDSRLAAVMDEMHTVERISKSGMPETMEAGRGFAVANGDLVRITRKERLGPFMEDCKSSDQAIPVCMVSEPERDDLMSHVSHAQRIRDLRRAFGLQK